MGMLQLWLSGLWPIVGHYVFWAASMAAGGALIFFRPALWKPVAWVLAVITAGTVCYAFGVYDGEKRVRAQCDFEKYHAVEAANEARAKAQRDLARKPSRWVRTPKPDINCRDC
jgi:hypothetical protein